jgi:hypothetical protein
MNTRRLVHPKAPQLVWLAAVALVLFSLSLSSAHATADAAKDHTSPIDNTTPEEKQGVAPTPTPEKSSTTTASPEGAVTTEPVASPAPTPEIRVKAVWNANFKDNKDRANYAGLNEIIVVKTSNLQGLINDSKCLDDKGQKKENCTEQQIALYMDGRKIQGLVPESGAPQVDYETLQFHLQRRVGDTDSANNNDETWADIFGRPSLTFDDRFWYRPTAVSVGLENGYALPTDTDQKKFQLIRIYRGWFWATSAFLLFLLVLIILLARRTDLLRDSAETPPGTRKQYSLARCQMAFWFVLVIASFILIWLVTGATDIITPSVLALIGIGAGTALGSAAIDVGKRAETTNQQTSLEAERDALTAGLAALETDIAATNDATTSNDLRQQRTAKLTRLNEVNTKIRQLLTGGVRPSGGFLSDLLKDANGSYSFHRLQMFVWTLVLGALFLHSVWSRVAMPEFSATLLALMGISAGTFLGFKLPGTQS